MAQLMDGPVVIVGSPGLDLAAHPNDPSCGCPREAKQVHRCLVILGRHYESLGQSVC